MSQLPTPEELESLSRRIVTLIFAEAKDECLRLSKEIAHGGKEYRTALQCVKAIGVLDISGLVKQVSEIIAAPAQAAELDINPLRDPDDGYNHVREELGISESEWDARSEKEQEERAKDVALDRFDWGYTKEDEVP